MSEHKIAVEWKRTSADFNYDSYNRAHQVDFLNGVRLPASAAAAFKGDPDRVDPEQALLAALSSCHMLTFLAIASKKGYIVDEYRDDAVCWLEKDADGRLAVTRAELSPRVRFGGAKTPGPEELSGLHRSAHEHCFVANSVKTRVSVR
ncbi:MAG: OsmC family protein [Elusimicrobia bacterium]|nr:OsmC family protein [Elusimicrobiota bacterium]MDE2424340.1 OsmC family protein [Elusimicrobiota bacterium]